jgi:hypothetical protein
VIRNRLKCLGAAAAVLGMLCSMTSVANADDFSVDSTDAAAVAVMAPSDTAVIKVELVAADDPEWGGDSRNECNLRAASGAHNVFASITSSNEDVATVEPASIEFTDCGVPVEVTITTHTCNGTANIGIALDSSKSPAPTHVEFNETSVPVTVNQGTSCDGNGGGITTCAQPAAPAWAAAIMQKNSIKPGSKTWSSLMTQVAQAMLPGASFPNPGADHPAYKVHQDDYAGAVLRFLEGQLDPEKTNFPKPLSEVARPGWVCLTSPTA